MCAWWAYITAFPVVVGVHNLLNWFLGWRFFPLRLSVPVPVPFPGSGSGPGPLSGRSAFPLTFIVLAICQCVYVLYVCVLCAFGAFFRISIGTGRTLHIEDEVILLTWETFIRKISLMHENNTLLVKVYRRFI